MYAYRFYIYIYIWLCLFTKGSLSNLEFGDQRTYGYLGIVDVTPTHHCIFMYMFTQMCRMQC